MEKAHRFKVILYVALVFALFLTPDLEAKGPVFRGGHELAVDSPNDKVLKKWADLAMKNAGQSFEIKVYPAGQLGGGAAMTEAARLGTQEWCFTDPGYVGSFYPAMTVFAAPYLWRDFDHFKRVMKSSILEELADDMASKTNLRPLVFVYAGRRFLTANKPILKPEDAKGMLIRSVPTEIDMDATAILGGTPTPVAFAELYMALKQGVVDAQHNPPFQILNNKFTEVQKYMILTGHQWTLGILCFSENKWKKLSSSDKQAIKSAALDASVYAVDLHRQIESDLIKKIEATGMKVIAIPDDSVFRKNIPPIVEKYRDKWGDLYERINSVQ